MSQGYVSGPCEIFVGTGVSQAFQFLGWSEDGVQLQILAEYEDIVSDFGGPAVPVDSQFMGEHGYSSMTLNKYNEATLQTIAKRRVGAGVVAGAIEANGLGSLMIAQGYSFPVLLYAPYNTLAFQSASIVKGYVFPTSWLHTDFTVPLSVRLKRPRIVFRHVPLWNSIALTAQLYTNTVPSPVPSTD